MNRPVFAILVLTICGLALSCGCEKDAKGPTDEELVSKVVADFQAAWAEHDLEKLMGLFSDSFRDNEGLGKTELEVEFAEEDVMQIFELKIDGMEIKVEMGKAKVNHLEMKSAWGSLDLRFALEKEGGKWMITSGGPEERLDAMPAQY